MANVSPTIVGNGWYGVALNATGSALNVGGGTLVGDSLYINDLIPDGFAIFYDEDGGTGMTAAALTWRITIPGDANNYPLSTVAGVAHAVALTTDPTAFAMMFSSFAAGVSPMIIAGCTITPVAAITGTGAGNDALKVTLFGHRVS